MGGRYFFNQVSNILCLLFSQRAFPEQTIDGLKVDGLDQNGSLSQKVFRHHARLHLPSLQLLYEKRLEEAFVREVDSQKKKDGKSLSESDIRVSLHQLNILGWIQVSAGRAIHRITAKINNILLVGDELGMD